MIFFIIIMEMFLLFSPFTLCIKRTRRSQAPAKKHSGQKAEQQCDTIKKKKKRRATRVKKKKAKSAADGQRGVALGAHEREKGNNFMPKCIREEEYTGNESKHFFHPDRLQQLPSPL